MSTHNLVEESFRSLHSSFPQSTEVGSPGRGEVPVDSPISTKLGNLFRAGTELVVQFQHLVAAANEIAAVV